MKDKNGLELKIGDAVVAENKNGNAVEGMIVRFINSLGMVTVKDHEYQQESLWEQYKVEKI